jgi:hypothetical protein
MNMASGPVQPLCPRKIRKQDDRSESEHCRDDEDEQRAPSDPVQRASQPPYARASGLRHARTLAAGAGAYVLLRLRGRAGPDPERCVQRELLTSFLLASYLVFYSLARMGSLVSE